jgi:hypothetical protein
MAVAGNEWSQLLKSTVEAFKTLVKNRLRTGETLGLDDYHDLIRDAVERTMPRHDSAIRGILQSETSLWSRPLEDGARTLGGAGALIIRGALEETLMGRLGSLRQEFAGAASRLDLALAQEKLRMIEGITPAWQAYVPHLSEEREVIQYIENFLAEILPDGGSLVMVASILGSDPKLYNRPPVREPTLRDTILKTFEKTVAEVLTDLFTQRQRQYGAAPLF